MEVESALVINILPTATEEHENERRRQERKTLTKNHDEHQKQYPIFRHASATGRSLPRPRPGDTVNAWSLASRGRFGRGDRALRSEQHQRVAALLAVVVDQRLVDA